MDSAATESDDRFAAVFGTVRSTGRPESEGDEDPEIISVAKRQQRILALIAAHGILGHNSAVSMPDSFSAGRIEAMMEHGGQPNLPSDSPVSDELRADLRILTSSGLLRCWKDCWMVTREGLVALWTGDLLA
jgi:hypothetical protein